MAAPGAAPSAVAIRRFFGGIPSRRNDCKSDGLRLHRFESCRAHSTENPALRGVFCVLTPLPTHEPEAHFGELDDQNGT